MKSSDKKKPVKTIPKGVWESQRPQNPEDKFNKTTDLQGNGYPISPQNKHK